MDEEEHYNSIFPIKLDQEYYWLIFLFRGGSDYFTVNQEFRILLFSDPEKLVNFAKEQQIKLDSDSPFELDVDALKDWLRQPDSEINFEFFLDAWHFFSDVARSANQSYKGDESSTGIDSIYDKLFFGTHPTPENPAPTSWEAEEIYRLQEILKDGLLLFEENSAKIN